MREGMADPTGPRAGRRLTDPMATFAGDDARVRTNLPVPVGKIAAAKPATAAGAYEAQLIGQDGVKRGLRGGQPVLDHARSAYLGTEWSGPADRRPAKGALTRTKI